jgi:hypothetical protein
MALTCHVITSNPQTVGGICRHYEEARNRTGVDRVSREAHVGISIERRQRGRLVISWDLIRLNLRLVPPRGRAENTATRMVTSRA